MKEFDSGFDWADLGIPSGGLGQSDYGTLIADNFDWPDFRDTLANNDGHDMTFPDFFNTQTFDLFGSASAPKFVGQSVADGPEIPGTQTLPPETSTKQEEIQLLGAIVDLSAQIQELDLLEGSAKDILPLKQRRNQHQLDLYHLTALPVMTREAKLVSLELEKTVLRLEELKMTLSSDELNEDEERAHLDWTRIKLRKELQNLKKQAAESKSPEQTGTPYLPASHTASRSITPGSTTISGVASPSPSAEPVRTSTKRPLEVDGTSNESIDDSAAAIPTLVHQQDLNGGSMSIFRITMHKKPKRSQEQTQNRKDVMNAGGQCLKCRTNRSRPPCIGDQVCSQCEKDNLECIRPTLKDKNIFIEKLDFAYQPISSSESSTKRIQFDFVAAITKDFFDFSGHRFMKRHPDLLPLLDKLYACIVDFGFNASVSDSRKLALGGPCAFNIFVKSNTVLCNQHLRLVDDTIEDFVRPTIEIKFMEDSGVQEGSSYDEIEQRILQEVEKRKAEILTNFEGLRGLTSQYFFLILEEMLSDGNVRKAKRDLSRKASLLALVALTLENVLDFAESAKRTYVLDSQLEKQIGHLSLVLLTYLQPPSDLAFSKEVPINKCFGEQQGSICGVFLEDSFWYELYKASSAALPGHLLQVATKDPSLLPPKPMQNSIVVKALGEGPTPGPRQAYQDRVARMSHGYMGMNLDFSRREPRSSHALATASARPYASTPRASQPLDSELPAFGAPTDPCELEPLSSFPAQMESWWNEEPCMSVVSPTEPLGTSPCLYDKQPRMPSPGGQWVLPQDFGNEREDMADQMPPMQERPRKASKRNFLSLWKQK